MRIAVCVPELAPLRKMLEHGTVDDGTYVVQGYVASGLLARSHQVTFVAPRSLDETECATDLARPRLVERTWSNTWWFNGLSKVAWRSQQIVGVPYLNVFSNYRVMDAAMHCLPGHDIVYERNGLHRVGIARACKRLGLPYVVFFEADQFLEQDVMGRHLNAVLRWRAEQILRENLRSADCVICVSEQGRERAISAWNVPPDRVRVFSNGVDSERFKPDPEARAAVRASLGVADEPLVVFVGTFYEWHDVTTVLDAFAALRVRHPSAKLVLVGDGATRGALEQRAVALGVADHVRFTGLVNHRDVPRLLAAADIAVAPYPAMEHDLWLSPLKLFEYMGTGLPIVATRVGQVAHVLTHEISALLVPPSDPEAMAASVHRLIEDRALARRLGEQARRDAVSRHSWAQYAENLEAVFTSLVERRHGAQTGNVSGQVRACP